MWSKELEIHCLISLGANKSCCIFFFNNDPSMCLPGTKQLMGWFISFVPRIKILLGKFNLLPNYAHVHLYGAPKMVVKRGTQWNVSSCNSYHVRTVSVFNNNLEIIGKVTRFNSGVSRQVSFCHRQSTTEYSAECNIHCPLMPGGFHTESNDWENRFAVNEENPRPLF